MSTNRQDDNHNPHIDTSSRSYVRDNVYIDGGDFINRDKHVHGDEVYGDKITYILQGYVSPPLNYRSDIADIITFYTRTFVGRKREWTEITRFAKQKSPGYMLVEASPGYGKSALIAHLIQHHETERLEYGSKPNLLYYFIRNEGQRHTPEAFLLALNSQLLTLLHQPGGIPTELNSLHSQFSELWAQALSTANPDQPLLLLVDGLDEQSITGEVTIAHLLPANLADYVHVVVTSRPNPEPLQTTTLEHPFRQANIVRLHTFGKAEIEALLMEYGTDANNATKSTPRVLTITQGEPLFARFVCREVAEQGEVVLTELEKNPPADVEVYFKEQFKQLKSLAEGDLAWSILGLLTVSLSGMTVEQIDEVLNVSQLRKIHQAIGPVRRFLLGETQLELMHAQLGKVLSREFSPDEQTKFRQMFMAWCNSYQARQWPSETPVYVVHNYASHLALADAPPTDFYALISRERLHLWESIEGTPAGFLNDVHRAWLKANEGGTASLSVIVRAALCFASVGSLSSNAPSELIVACLKVGAISKSAAVLIAKQKTDMKERAICLALISDYLPKMERHAVLAEALELIPALKSYKRSDTLLVVAEHLPSEATSLTDQILSSTREIKTSKFRIRILCALAQNAPLQVHSILSEALEITSKIEDERTLCLQIVAKCIPPHAKDLFARILADAQAIEEESQRADVICAMIERLPANAYDLFAKALEATYSIEDTYTHTKLLHSIMEHMPPDTHNLWGEALAVAKHRTSALFTVLAYLPHNMDELWGEALAITCKITEDDKIVRALQIVVLHLPSTSRDLWVMTLSTVSIIENERYCAKVIAIITTYLPVDAYDLWAEILTKALALKEVWAQVEALCAVLEHLPLEANDLWGKVLFSAYALEDGWPRARVLSAMAEHLPPSEYKLLDDVSTAIRAIKDERWRATALVVLAKCLPIDAQQSMLFEALEIARSIKYGFSRGEALSAIAKFLPPDEQRHVFAEALEAICREDNMWLANNLCKIVEDLPPDMHDEWSNVLSAACSIENEMYRVEALRGVVKHLPAYRDDLLSMAISTLSTIENTWRRTEAFCEIVDRLSPDAHSLLSEALAVACAIEDKDGCVKALHAVAKRLSTDAYELWTRLFTSLANLIADQERDERFCFTTLSMIAECLPLNLSDLWAKTLAFASKMSESDRARFLCIVSERLLPNVDNLWTEIINIACEIKYPSDRAQALYAIADRLPPNLSHLFSKALVAKYAINDTDSRAKTLLALTDYLSSDGQDALLSELMSSIDAIEKDKTRAAVIQTIVQHLSPDSHSSCVNVLKATRLIEDAACRVNTLLAIAKCLPASEQHHIFEEVFINIQAVYGKRDRIDALLTMAHYLPRDKQRKLLLDALHIARSQEPPRFRILSLIEITKSPTFLELTPTFLSVSSIMELLRKEERLPNLRTILQEAVTEVHDIEEGFGYNLTLDELSSYLQSVAPDLLMEILKKIRAYKSDEHRAYALTIAAEHLPAVQKPVVLNEALVAARLIPKDRTRAYALRTVASGLPLSQRHDVLAEALSIARVDEDEGMKKNTLSSIIKYVPPADHDLLAQGLEIARSINDKQDRVEALSNVAYCLPPDQQISVLTEALAITQTIEGEWGKSSAVLAVAKNLPADARSLRRDVLRMVNELVNESNVYDIIETLVPYWLEMFENDTRAALIAFSETLKFFSQTERSMLLRIIEIFTPLIHRLGGECAVRETSEAIIDTTKWWP